MYLLKIRISFLFMMSRISLEATIYLIISADKIRNTNL